MEFVTICIFSFCQPIVIEIDEFGYSSPRSFTSYDNLIKFNRTCDLMPHCTVKVRAEPSRASEQASDLASEQALPMLGSARGRERAASQNFCEQRAEQRPARLGSQNCCSARLGSLPTLVTSDDAGTSSPVSPRPWYLAKWPWYLGILFLLSILGFLL